MRVTMLVRCLAMMRGGGETRHLNWMRELQALGVDVDVITGQPLLFGGPRHPIAGDHVTVLRSPYVRDAVYRWQHTRGFGRLTMNALHWDEDWFCRAAWRRIAARTVRPDIVHAHALYQAASVRPVNIPVVINFPGEPHPSYLPDIRQADALVADGWAAEHLPAIVGKPVHAVPKGVDAELFRPTGANLRQVLGLGDRRIVLSVGRFVPIKNMALLIEALAKMVPADPSLHLLLVGEGPELQSLKDQAGRLGVARAVTFAGYVPQAEMAPYYRTADLFALGSDFDNSPNVVLEAMACGLPVVATAVGGVAEYIASGRGGDLVPRGDATAMSGVLGDWMSSVERRRAAGAFNRQRVLQEFSWRASATRLLEVYRGVLQDRHQMKATA
ncbi:MAG: glycosyltransferase family 4 protein [Acidobacteriota bacterium]|nr:glycosyltransferase family 4 protein [Acidobacteriota bacterium]